MKFTLTALAPFLFLAPAYGFLDNCYCRSNETPFWKGNIDTFISRYQAAGPNELKIPAFYNERIDYIESPVAVVITTSASPVTLTKQAAVDLFWE